MYEYPIFKYLVQFSSLVDVEGKLKDIPTPSGGQQTEEKKDQLVNSGENARNDD
jgi:hypothetical protein